MKVYNILSTLDVGNNTSVIVDAPMREFYKGIGIIDENGKPHEVLSIGMSCGSDAADSVNSANLLVQGKFVSKKMYV